MESRSASFDRRTRSDVDSWVEVSSQPSSSSLSSIGDDIVTTGGPNRDDQRTRRRRRLGAPTHLNITRTAEATSSQEEYEESESESDRIMTSSGEGPMLAAPAARNAAAGMVAAQRSLTSESSGAQASDDDDENKTAINYPINNDTCFTPLPNAFSHPPSSQMRGASQPVPGSYFPPSRPVTSYRSATRNSLPETRRQSHLPQNVLSPSFNAAAEHDEALRASLTSLLSVAAAARGLPKPESKRPQQTTTPPRSNRVDPTSFRLVPESALQSSPPTQLQVQEPTFKPTIRRTSTNSTSTNSERVENKRKAVTAPGRSTSRERRALKKARRSASNEDLHVTPTLLTWVVSAGVVVFLSALSFSAGYSMGREAGMLEASNFSPADESLRSCAREASRSSLGLKRSLARSAIQV
ncbi:hypothetical protein M409DRAFT_63078 [Zasmidium cellare ATCC 36951]|uniref:Uncharacterized protein n=1 Tax=Zasmidium cellare ATCC 36951 TaxID=1080233 RepID=A0A6A6D3Y8_ZASCE|nr:uncharacterized protein M409DRAFT_63078 [Zasmidium cellare ATCC 36951]KAF2172366.1 hypothetical protein M409DRAFT_63078 [Zasmidium cellare ATCC 36951]